MFQFDDVKGKKERKTNTEGMVILTRTSKLNGDRKKRVTRSERDGRNQNLVGMI